MFKKSIRVYKTFILFLLQLFQTQWSASIRPYVTILSMNIDMSQESKMRLKNRNRIYLSKRQPELLIQLQRMFWASRFQFQNVSKGWEFLSYGWDGREAGSNSFFKYFKILFCEKRVMRACLSLMLWCAWKCFLTVQMTDSSAFITNTGWKPQKKTAYICFAGKLYFVRATNCINVYGELNVLLQLELCSTSSTTIWRISATSSRKWGNVRCRCGLARRRCQALYLHYASSGQ